jgi:hypothetical protein
VTPEDSILNFSINSINGSGQLTNAAGATVPLGTTLVMRAAPIGVSQSANAQPIEDAAGPVFFGDNNPSGYSTCHENVNVNSTGVAEFDTQLCAPGAHSMSAQYNGDLSYNPSNAGPINFTVAQGSTSVVLSSTANSINFGGTLLTAMLNGSASTSGIYPSGPVVFTNTTTNTVIGTSYTVEPTCNGSQSTCVTAGIDLDVSQLILGPNAIIATYNSTTDYAGSVSAPLTITCAGGCTNAAGQLLMVSLQSIGQRAFSPGESSTAGIGVSSQGGFSGSVNVTCSITGTNGADQNVPTCSANPTAITVTAVQAASSTITIKTVGPITGQLGYPGNGLFQKIAGAALACVLCLGVPAARRRWASLLALALCLVAFCSIPGCGGGSGSGSSSSTGGGSSSAAPQTTADTYTVTIHAADAATGTLTAQNSFTITVN